MTTYDIFKHPEHYFLVQFAVAANGDATPLGASPFSKASSRKYPDYPFIGTKASKYGLRRRKGATHWAIVYSGSDDEVAILHYGRMDSVNRKKRIIPFNYGTDYYLILRGSDMHMKIIVSTRDVLPRSTPHSSKEATA